MECVELVTSSGWSVLHVLQCVAACCSVLQYVAVCGVCHMGCVDCVIPSTHMECHTYGVCGVSHDSALHPPTPHDSFTCVTCLVH